VSGCKPHERVSTNVRVFLASGPNLLVRVFYYVRVLISCQGNIHRQRELLKSGCSTPSGCFYQVRVLILCQGELLKSGCWQPSKAHQGEVVHQGVKSKSGGFCTNFTAGQDAKKVVTGNVTFMEKQCGPHKIKVHNCLAENRKESTEIFYHYKWSLKKAKSWKWQALVRGITFLFLFSHIYLISLYFIIHLTYHREKEIERVKLCIFAKSFM